MTIEERFEEWWSREGRWIDPDTSGAHVPSSLRTRMAGLLTMTNPQGAEALIRRWREHAQDYRQIAADAPRDGDIAQAMHFSASAVTLDACADELAAALSGGARPQECINGTLQEELLDLITLMPDSQTQEIIDYIQQLRYIRKSSKGTLMTARSMDLSDEDVIVAEIAARIAAGFGGSGEDPHDVARMSLDIAWAIINRVHADSTTNSAAE